MFPNAKIIIDKFNLTQLISRFLNKTRIRVMNKDKKNHRKLKRYWRLILKDKDELNFSKCQKYTFFDSLTTKSDVVNYLINTDEELKQILNNTNSKISNYMKPSIKTLLKILITKDL